MKIPSSGDEGTFVRGLKIPSTADEDAFVKKRFFYLLHRLPVWLLNPLLIQPFVWREIGTGILLFISD